MSVKQMGIAWELDLAPNYKIVLLALADHADDDGGNVYPSVGRIAHKTGYNERQVQRIMGELRTLGIIEQIANAEGGRGKTTRYQLHLLKGDRLTPFVPESQQKGDNQAPKRVTSETVKGDAHVTRTISEPPVEPPEEDSVSHETALAPLSTPYLIVEQGCQVMGIEARDYTPKQKAKQCGFVKQMLTDGVEPADILGCVGWLWADDFRKRTGVDFKTVLDNIPKYISASRSRSPTPISRAPSRKWTGYSEADLS